jgi:hypothetical protein
MDQFPTDYRFFINVIIHHVFDQAIFSLARYQIMCKIALLRVGTIQLSEKETDLQN